MSKFKDGDKVRVVSAQLKSYWYADLIGKEFIIINNNTNSFGWNIKGHSGYYLRECDIELVKDNKKISPEDEVTITTTYGELAKVYAVMGCVNGKDYGKNIFNTVANILDPSQSRYDNVIYTKIPKTARLEYVEYQDKWIKALFGEQESEEEKAKALKIKELEESINNAKKQLEELKSLK